MSTGTLLWILASAVVAGVFYVEIMEATVVAIDWILAWLRWCVRKREQLKQQLKDLEDNE